VPRIIRAIVMQVDPDMRAALDGMLALIHDAYDRRAISWARRCEMIAAMDEKNGGGLYDCRHYPKAHPDPEVDCYGVYIEPSAAFLAEIGAPAWQP